MFNITKEEWIEQVPALAERLQTAFPLLTAEVTAKEEIWLKTEACTGSISLRTPEKGSSYYVHAQGAGGSALLGKPSTMEAGLRQYRAILDALHFVAAKYGDTKIWEAGECPCGQCSGRGTQRHGIICPECNGKGLR